MGEFEANELNPQVWYSRYVETVCQSMGDRMPWPEKLLTEKSTQPTVLTSKSEFLEQMRTGNHIDKIVVLKDGAALLDRSVPKLIENAVKGSVSADQFLDKLSAQGTLATMKGKIFIPKRRSENEDWFDTPVEPPSTDENTPTMQNKWEELCTYSPKERKSAYIAELRYRKAVKRNGRWLKSMLPKTMREQVGMDEMIYWDDYSEGIFVGCGGTAYSLHCDQLQSSNVGTQFTGHKLLAIWQYPVATYRLLNDDFRTVFTFPLTPHQITLLESAICVAMVPPGAVWFFCGANAHATCNLGIETVVTQKDDDRTHDHRYHDRDDDVDCGNDGEGDADRHRDRHRDDDDVDCGDDDGGRDRDRDRNRDREQTRRDHRACPSYDIKETICVNSYEAFVNTNLQHVETMVGTNTKIQFEDTWMDGQDFHNFKSDVRDEIEGLESQLANKTVPKVSISRVKRAINIGRTWINTDYTDTEGSSADDDRDGNDNGDHDDDDDDRDKIVRVKRTKVNHVTHVS